MFDGSASARIASTSCTVSSTRGRCLGTFGSCSSLAGLKSAREPLEEGLKRREVAVLAAERHRPAVVLAVVKEASLIAIENGLRDLARILQAALVAPADEALDRDPARPDRVLRVAGDPHPLEVLLHPARERMPCERIVMLGGRPWRLRPGGLSRLETLPLARHRYERRERAAKGVMRACVYDRALPLPPLLCVFEVSALALPESLAARDVTAISAPRDPPATGPLLPRTRPATSAADPASSSFTPATLLS